MITREDLYALVWAQPMTKVCEQFGVSSSYMARVCTLLNVPRPPRGHWQKLAVGKADPQEALPEALPGDQTTWNEKGGLLPAPARSRPVREPSTRRPLKRGRKPAEGTHPIVRGTLVEFRRSRPVKSWSYLRPFKQLLPDVIAADATIERALDVASKVYNELEAQGARVVIAPGDQRWHGISIDEREVPKGDRQRHYYQSSLWSPLRPTIAFFEDTAIGIAVLEMSEDVLLQYVGSDLGVDGYIRESEYRANPRKYRQHHTWTTNQDLPCGRLRLVAYSADANGWSRTWQEKGTTTLEASLPRIAKEIRAAVPYVITLVEEARRQAEVRHQEWLAQKERLAREEDRRRIEESTKQSRQALGQVIDRWADRMAVERFFEEMARSIEQLPNGDRAEMQERLRLAREFMGSVDPLDFFRGWKIPSEIYEPKY